MTARRREHSHSRRQPRLWRIPAVLGGLLVIALASGVLVYAFPATEQIRRADAIVVLGGLDGGPVLAEAQRLAESGYSDTLFVSTAFGQDTRAENLCARPSALRIDCFQPEPATTKGEAQAVRQMAAERGWERIIVVTATYHVSRARYVTGQCFEGDMIMRPVPLEMTPEKWAFQFVYQTAAYVKAAATPSCDDAPARESWVDDTVEGFRRVAATPILGRDRRRHREASRRLAL